MFIYLRKHVLSEVILHLREQHAALVRVRPRDLLLRSLVHRVEPTEQVLPRHAAVHPKLGRWGQLRLSPGRHVRHGTVVDHRPHGLTVFGGQDGNVHRVRRQVGEATRVFHEIPKGNCLYTPQEISFAPSSARFWEM